MSVTDPPTPASLPGSRRDGARPPATGSWRVVYVLVIGVLAADIVALWLLGVVFG